MKTLVLLFTLLLIGLSVTALDADEKKLPLRVCLISGSFEYESHKTLPILQKFLETRYGAVCTRAFAKSETDLPGLENLDSCDVAVLYTRRLKLQGEQLQRIKKYCQSGKPLVGLRTASHGVQSWLEIDKEVFGGNYKGHFGVGPLADVKFAPGAKDHPILKGVQPFQSKGSLYKNTGLSKDVNLLLTGTTPGESEPIAWTRLHKGGRVFYTSLGHQKDFEEESFLRLIGNAIVWTAQRDK